MKYRLNFKLWDKKITHKFYMERVWLGGFWTPLITVRLRIEDNYK